jgi:hypothetical protein
MGLGGAGLAEDWAPSGGSGDCGVAEIWIEVRAVGSGDSIVG